MPGRFVCSLDVGTTTIRCLVFDPNCQVKGKAESKVHIIFPKAGWVEIEPRSLWETIIEVINEAIKDAGLQASDIDCLGISTQRATFINWDRRTGEPFHNFVTWQDLRADSLVKEWNSAASMKLLRYGSKILYTLTRQQRYMVGSILHLHNKMVVMRLLWTIQNIPEIAKAAAKNDAMFGTLECWLLYKFSGGKLHMTDIGNVAATGIFDPFTCDYASWIFHMFNIPRNIMPKIVDSAGTHFGATDPAIFDGHSIPIRAVMADQSASLFGSGCFNPGDTKMTLGTGSFLDVNTGSAPHASMKGLVPLVGWRVGKEIVYIAEGSNHATGTIIEWAKQIEMFDDPKDSCGIANSVPDSNGVYFIPAFCGLQAPILDPQAAAGYLGISRTTERPHLLRSLLESVAFSMKQLLEIMEHESNYSTKVIEIDGGVSKNDFIVQLISTLTGKKIERPSSAEMSSLGVAFLAGLETGIWKSREELPKFRKIEREFVPDRDLFEKQNRCYQQWVKACYRFTLWNERE